MTANGVEPDEVDLHCRLMAGDPTASEEIARLLLNRLIRAVTSSGMGKEDIHLAESACEDALLSYLKRPDQYDPSRAPLFKYLKMAAFGDLANLKRKSKKVVELQPLPREEGMDDQTPEVSSIGAETDLLKTIAKVLPDEQDQDVLFLMMNGERDTAIFAEVLRIGHLSAVEQAEQVKRHKDRIKKTLKRKMNPSNLRS